MAIDAKYYILYKQNIKKWEITKRCLVTTF